MPDTLSLTQAMRYNRHIVLPQVDLAGQERLLRARVLLIGLGGLGCAAAQSLCASGVGHLTLVDDDKVEAHNLPRQILYTPDEVGQYKVVAAQRKLRQLNPQCTLATFANRLDDAGMTTQISQHDLILDCTDNIASREQLNRLCFAANRPLVSGAAIRFEGHLFVSLAQADAPCYGCMRILFEAPDASCVENGIFSPVVSLIGVQQALLAMQIIVGFGEVEPGILRTFDGLTHSWQQYRVPKQANCPVCAPQLT